VNASGNVLLDTFVSQKESVSDYRTWVSGVTPQHLAGAPSLEEVQKQVCVCVCVGGGGRNSSTHF
jgi:RNA exonuclease 4